jgi:release factor glutamine methyltransferase
MSGRTVKTLLNKAAAQFGGDSALLDAQLLMGKVIGKDRSWLYAHDDAELTEAQASAFQSLAERRRAGEPVAYLLGSRGFWKQELAVGPAVLIPRPETELLVELVMELALGQDIQMADLGTGSGAIALALASENPEWEVFATDISADALAVAEANAQRLGIENVCFCQGDWLAALPAIRFNLIVSNPPYIAPGDPHLQEGDLRFEPAGALVAGEQGLADLTRIAENAGHYLKSRGWLLLEHGRDQGRAVRHLLETLRYDKISTHFDHNGNERVTMGAWHAG